MGQLTLHIYLLFQLLQIQQYLLLFLLLSHYQLIDILHHYPTIPNPLLHDHYRQVSKQVCYAGVVILYVILRGVGRELFADVDVGVHVLEGGVVEVYDLALGFAAEGAVSVLGEGVELVGDVDDWFTALLAVLLPLVHQLPDQGSGFTRLYLLDLLLKRLNLPLSILQQSLEISDLTEQLLILLLEQLDHIRCLLQSLILQLTLSYQLLNRHFVHILTRLLLQLFCQFYLVDAGTNAALVLLGFRGAVGLEVGWSGGSEVGQGLGLRFAVLLVVFAVLSKINKHYQYIQVKESGQPKGRRFQDIQDTRKERETRLMILASFVDGFLDSQNPSFSHLFLLHYFLQSPIIDPKNPSQIDSPIIPRKMNIFIFHRDLRLFDNTSLILQILRHMKITPIFIFTPQQIVPQNNAYFSHNSVQFMVQTLDQLHKEVESLGGRLYYFYGDSLEVVERIHKAQKIGSIFYNFDYTPFAKRRDSEIAQWAAKKGIEVHSEEDYVLYPILEGKNLSQKTQKPYLVFTPFKNHCLGNLKVNKPNDFQFQKAHFEKSQALEKLECSLSPQKIHDFYERNDQIRVHGGRKNALKILSKIRQFKDYNKQRNNPIIPTTALSAYLHFTPVSIRQVYHTVLSQLGIQNNLINQLHWRDFYVNITHHFPKVLAKKDNSFQAKFDKVQWKYNPQQLQAWKQGKTGFPIIDAAMRELNTTGFMHNRCRMITASFFAKDLFLDWHEGERYFATKLVDFSAMQNSGGWQWTVGNGTDAQPYFRIFNPWTQQVNYDADCKYIKKWLPELESVPNEDIHKWFSTCEKHVKRGVKYPKPIIDHDVARKDTLEVYKSCFGTTKEK